LRDLDLVELVLEAQAFVRASRRSISKLLLARAGVPTPADPRGRHALQVVPHGFEARVGVLELSDLTWSLASWLGRGRRRCRDEFGPVQDLAAGGFFDNWRFVWERGRDRR